MEERTRRLHILDEAEVAALFERPHFDDEQRAAYFSLSAQEELLLSGLHSVKSRCHFILQLGYFKHSYQFFSFSSGEVKTDMRYVQERYFPHETLADVEFTKVTRLKQQKQILGLFNFRTCDAEDRRILQSKAEQAARISTKPLYIFRELMEHLSRRRRVTPAYTSLQDLVGRALSFENGRLTQLFQDRLGKGDVEALQHLLDDSEGLHKITQLRQQPKDSSVKEMKSDIPASTPFGDFQQQVFTILERTKLEQVSQHITGKVIFDETGITWTQRRAASRRICATRSKPPSSVGVLPATL